MNEVSVSFRPRKPVPRIAGRPSAKYPARIAKQLALAHSLQERVHKGEFRDYAAMARALGFSRARVTQLMDLLLLAPDIQEEILGLECAPGQQPFSERVLRSVLKFNNWAEQRAAWQRVAPSR